MDPDVALQYLANGDLIKAVVYGLGLGDLIWPILAGMLFALARVKLRSGIAVGVLGLMFLGFGAAFVQNTAIKAGMVAAGAAVIAGVLAWVAAGRER